MHDTIGPRFRTAGVLGLLVTSLAIANACTPDEPMEKARERQSVGDFEASLEPLRERLANDPDDPEALYRYGLALNQLGQSSMAHWALLRAMDHPDWLVVGAFQAASGTMRTNNWDETITLMDRVVEVDPNNVDAIALRAHARLRVRDQYEEALEDVERVLELDPNDQGILVSRAIALLGLERIEEAGAALEDLKANFRESSPSQELAARYCVANAMFAAAEERLEEAEGLYQGCFDDFTDTAVAVMGLLSFYDHVGQGEKALGLLRKLVADEPTTEDYRSQLVERLEEAGQFDEAAKLLHEATEFEDEEAVLSAWFNVGRYYMARRDYDRAAEAAKKVVELSPLPVPDFYSYYAEALFLAERYDEALAVADEMTVAAHQALVRARVAFERGEYESALQFFDISLKTWPENPVARYYAARSAVELGDFDRARAEFRYTLRSDPDATDARFRLARQLAAQGAHGAVVSVVSHAGKEREGEKKPDVESLLIGLESLGALGRMDALEKALKNILERSPSVTDARAASAAARGVARRSGPEAGIRVLTQMLIVDLKVPENAPVLATRIELEAEAGRPEKAVELATAALEASPDRAIFHETLAAARARAAAPATEVALGYRRALELDPSRTPSLLALARQDADAGDLAAALARIDAFLEKNPEIFDAELTRQRAAWLLATGREDQARLQLQNVLSENPTDAAAALALARWHLERGGDRGAAARYARQADRFGGGDEARALAEELAPSP